VYVSVAGWLEVNCEQRQAVETIIEASQHDWSGGWGLPARPGSSWSWYVLYGADIREAALPGLRGQVSLIAALPPVDDDGDMPVGVFFLRDERGGVRAWEIRDGKLHDRPAPEFGWMWRE
jgi:hypothetical protein